MKNIINRKGSKRVSSFFRNSNASYDKQKRLGKAEKQKNNNLKGEQEIC